MLNVCLGTLRTTAVSALVRVDFVRGREQQLNHTPREMRCAASILDESVLQQAQQQQDTESIYEGLC